MLLNQVSGLLALDSLRSLLALSIHLYLAKEAGIVANPKLQNLINPDPRLLFKMMVGIPANNVSLAQGMITLILSPVDFVI